MRYWKYSDIADKVKRDLGIEQEEFITSEELMGYCNAAIDDAESEIHTIYEDYFLTSAALDTVGGTNELSMPENIYANKVRGVVYNDGSTTYTVTRYKNSVDMFELIELDKESTSNTMRYFLMNDSATNGVNMMLIPAPKVDKVGAIKVYYIRNANRMVDNESLCDIPEFVDYVMQFMKVRCYEKEGHPNTQLAVGMLDYKKKNLINTLSNMIPDGDNAIEADTSFYWEMGSGLEINMY